MTYAPYEMLLNGSYLGGVVKAYDIPLGDNGWFWVLLYLLGLVIVAIYTESPSNTVIASILGGAALFEFMPAVSLKMFFIIATFALTITLFKYFSHKQGSAV